MDEIIEVAPLAVTRFTVPVPSASQVVRERVLRLLDEATGAPIVLVTGGPGTGKTLAVATWVREGRPPAVVAWLSLDEVVSTPARFWGAVVAALRGVLPGDALAGLHVPLRGHDLFVEELASRLVGHRVVLVLDDAHQLPGEVLTSLDQLLRRSPPGLVAVLVARHDLPLTLHRHRVEGRVRELRVSDLAFTVPEVGQLLAASGVALPREAVDHLVQVSEGWAAGLRLAVLTLSGAEDPVAAVYEFDGRQPLVAGYLADEVLRTLGPERAQFLLRTSITERVCGPLAAVLTGDRGAAAVLESLFVDEPLIVNLENSGWYHYHPLLQQMLRARLRRDDPDLERRLHRGASQWFEQEGEWIAALEHAVSAGQPELAARVALRSAMVSLFTGERARLASAIDGIPLDGMPMDGELLTLRAVAAGCRGDSQTQLSFSEQARARLAEVPEPGRSVARLDLLVLAAVQALQVGDPTAMVRLGTAAGRVLEVLGPADAPGWMRFRGMPMGIAAIGRLWAGRPREALDGLRQATAHDRADRPRASSDVYHAGYVALALVCLGLAGDARATARAALDVAGTLGIAHGYQAAPAWMSLAMAEQHLGDGPACEVALATVENVPGVDPVVASMVVLLRARAAACAGDLARARRALDEVDRRLLATPDLQLVRRLRTSLAVEIELHTGSVSRARTLLDAHDGPGPDRGDAPPLEPTEPDVLSVMRGRVLLAEGRVQDAAAVADLARGAAGQVGACAWVLDALAEDRMRHDANATRSLSHALERASPGIPSLFVRPLGPRLTSMLRRHVDIVGTHRDVVLEVLAEGSDRGSAAGDGTVPGQWASPLTERELAVLAYLATMRSNAEIAEELAISVNTVKQHLKSIHRKLGVSSRRDAVSVARGLELLPGLSRTL